MLWMHEFGVLDTLGAVIPVRAVKALVANAKDRLVTAVTKRSMLDIASWSAEKLSKRTKSVLSNGLESMGWMMTMLVGFMA
jgi:hypothetical protein